MKLLYNNLFKFKHSPLWRMLLVVILMTLPSCSNTADLSSGMGVTELDQPIVLDNFHIKGVPDEKAIIVSSNFQLRQLFGKIPEELGNIDFRKFKLIYVQGVSSCGFGKDNFRHEWETSTIPVTLKINIGNGTIATANIQKWGAGFIVTKESTDKIYVQVTYLNKP